MRDTEAADWGLDGKSDPLKDRGCVRLENFDREKLLTTTPPDVYLTLERRDLMNDYGALTDTLYNAKKGTAGAWKSSALSRALHIRGHDGALAARNVSMYLTKTGNAVGSTIKLCFVDRAIEPTYVVPDVYNDDHVLKFAKGTACLMNPIACEELGRLPEGVWGQVYDDRKFESDVMRLPVGLLKFLDKKGLLLENMKMGAMINTGDRTGFTAAQIVADFKAKFRNKGVKIFYVQKRFGSSGTEPEWHHWFEYADIDVVGEGYEPTSSNGNKLEYPQGHLDVYNACRNGDTKGLAMHIAKFAGQKKWGGCGDVAGAIGRQNFAHPRCKCKNEDDKVYCGDQFVASRKFDRDSILSLAGCTERSAYCSAKPCLPPSNRP